MSTLFTAPAEAPPREYPFWSYLDLLLFLGLAVPSLIVSMLLVRGVLGLLPWPVPNKPTLGLYAQFVAYGFWLGSLWLILKTRYQEDVGAALGWVAPRHPRRLAQCLFGGPALALSVAFIAHVLRTPQIEDPFIRLVSGKLSIAVLGICVMCLGPVFEELLFRGFLLPLLVRDIGAPAGILAAAVPFALLHGPQYSWQWQHVLLILMVGSLLGLVRFRTGSTMASTVLHVSYNATLFMGYMAELLHRSAV